MRVFANSKQRDGGRRKSDPAEHPHWHKDAKWICGILFLISLALALAAYSFFRLTDEKVAVRALGTGLAAALSREGLDSEIDIGEFQRQVAESPTKSIRPIPSLMIEITEAEIAGKSPREVRLYIFEKLARPFYEGGPAGLAAISDNPEMVATIDRDSQLIQPLTKESHERFGRWAVYLSLLSALLLAGVVYFSYHWGRLASPGLLLLLAGLPAPLLYAIASAQKNEPFDPSAGTVGRILHEVAPVALPTAALPYLVVLLSGLGLLLTAGIGRVVLRHREGT